MANQQHSAAEAVRRLALGYIVSRSIYVATELGIADLVMDGAKTAEDLAQATKTDPQKLYRILRVLAGEGVFEEHEGHLFSQTPMSQSLSKDGESSIHAYVIHKNVLEFPALIDIMHTINSGEPAFNKTFGMPPFEYLQKNVEAAAIFQAGMAAGHGRENVSIAEAIDFSGVGIVVDVGGGNGSLLYELLTHYSHLKGVLFELEPAIAKARTGLVGSLDRCDFVQGNFFDEVTPDGDIYILKKVVHNWNDEQVITILRNCRKAMRDDGKVLIIETLVGPPNEPTWGKMQDFTMLLVSTGMERTESEYSDLLSKAGLKLDKIHKLSEETAVIEAGVA